MVIAAYSVTVINKCTSAAFFQRSCVFQRLISLLMLVTIYIWNWYILWSDANNIESILLWSLKWERTLCNGLGLFWSNIYRSITQNVSILKYSCIEQPTHIHLNSSSISCLTRFLVHISQWSNNQKKSSTFEWNQSSWIVFFFCPRTQRIRLNVTKYIMACNKRRMAWKNMHRKWLLTKDDWSNGIFQLNC